MFNEAEIKLAEPTYSALLEVADILGKDWEWKPKAGDWVIWDALKHHAGIIIEYDKTSKTICYGIPFDTYNCPDVGFARAFYIPGYSDEELSYAFQIPDCSLDSVIPIFHWKELEEILKSFGYKLYMRFEFRGGGHFQVAIYDIADRFSSYGIGETTQEAVMRAVIELAERYRIQPQREFRMVHADYNCCAVCDRRIKYAGLGAVNKEEICPQCKAKLAKKGVAVRNVRELIKWIKNEKAEKVAEILKDVGYRFCFYFNDVDHAVTEKVGDMVEIDDERHLILAED